MNYSLVQGEDKAITFNLRSKIDQSIIDLSLLNNIVVIFTARNSILAKYSQLAQVGYNLLTVSGNDITVRLDRTITKDFTVGLVSMKVLTNEDSLTVEGETDNIEYTFKDYILVFEGLTKNETI